MVILQALIICVSPCMGRECSLENSINKYRNIKISDSQRRRLSEIDYLIQYYCDFAFSRGAHKINPDFMRALILAESNADPSATSNKNARGLTQIMYTTGKQAALDLADRGCDYHYVSREELKNLTPDDLYRPAVNILIACYLIDKYNHQFQGQLDLVVSAWNAGEGSIKNDTPPPYAETTRSIGKINGYLIKFISYGGG